MKSKLYCPLLDSGFDQRHNTSCCHIKLKNRPSNAGAYFSSLEYASIKKDFENGIKSSYCNTCWEMEDAGGVSKRTITIRREKQLGISPNTEKVIYLTLFIGNKCNLYCRTCHSFSSTGFIKEEKWINQNYNFDLPVTGVQLFDYSQLDFDISQIRYIEVLGGEPLYDTSHFEYLDKFIETGVSKNIEITYATNATMTLTTEIKSRLDKFLKVNLLLSIDAVGKEFEYIRTGSNWNITHNNIKQYIDFKNYADIFITVHPTISILNCTSLESLYQYFQNLNIFEGNIIFVEKPEHYSLNAIPEDKKQLIIDNVSYGSKTQIIKNKINTAEYDVELYKRFLTYVDITKQYRGLAIKEHLPLLSEILEI